MDLNRNTPRLHGVDRKPFTIFLFQLYFLLVHSVALHQIAFSIACNLLTSLLVKVRFRDLCHNTKLLLLMYKTQTQYFYTFVIVTDMLLCKYLAHGLRCNTSHYPICHRLCIQHTLAAAFHICGPFAPSVTKRPHIMC